MNRRSARLLLFTGKGGAGKPTVAAATALHAARCGVKTLVVSTDAAHSLADCFDHPLGADPVEVVTGLSAVQVDPRRRGERSWRAVQEYLIGVLDALGVDPIAAEELTVLPGAATAGTVMALTMSALVSETTIVTIAVSHAVGTACAQIWYCTV